MSSLEFQKASSSSKSSKSNTSDTPIQFVKGVGPRLAGVFASRGMSTVRDLLNFFPRAYEDRSRFLTIAQAAELTAGESATVSLEVISSRRIPLRGRRQMMLEVRCKDPSGVMGLKWFHTPRGLAEQFRPGVEFVASGKVKTFRDRLEMIHPEISWTSGAKLLNAGRVVPIYTEIEGVSTRLLRKILWNANEKYLTTLTDEVPLHLLQKHQLPGIRQCIRDIHFPENLGQSDDTIKQLIEFRSPGQQRLIYEEFLKFEYLVLKRRLNLRRETALAFASQTLESHQASLEKHLPFRLTGDQFKALKDIRQELSQAQPMNRLLQGDVGSGKTAVSLIAAGMIIAEGGQVALMAPTEILAEQHFRSAWKLFGTHLSTAYLSGSTSSKDRQKVLFRLQSGEPMLIIGTHALIEDDVVFKNLQLVMVDEQHRFGVEQRKRLRSKGQQNDLSPHQLVLTATPIPRTLALTAYGDLAVSSIREKPPGRSPILTQVVLQRQQARAYEDIRKQLRMGRQAYFVFPLVQDSEAEGFTELKSAQSEAERLQKEIFTEFKIGLLHGQMKSEEKTRIMDLFQRGQIQVLVATTVVEVGVDVPNATVMVIEHAERFGLSQLHQLRGRVGRGQEQSFCFLFTHEGLAENSSQRLQAMEAIEDGFRLSEIDLEMRGPGEFLGTRQSGVLPFRIADLIRDAEWLFKAREDAIEILKEDPDLQLERHHALRSYIQSHGQQQFERLQTS